jgi:hypothetical protein
MADPMFGATLVRLLVGEGLTVKAPHSDWMDHQRDSATGKPFGQVHGTMLHHTAALNAYATVYAGRSGLPGPLAHAYIDKAGVVWMCSDGRANHAGGGDPMVLNAVINESYSVAPPKTRYHEGSPGAADGNDAFYGFECENLGNGADPWPEVQYNAMVKAVAAIHRFYQWSEKSCIGHLEWSDQKVDPRGWPMTQFRADLKECLAQKPGMWPTVTVENGVTIPKEDRDAIARTVLTLDGVIENPNPETAETNPYISLMTSLRNIEIILRRTEAKLDILLTKFNQ